ncbi:PA14 domain-containing protein [Streptomyces sp. NPDC047928]|uniref:PA14 domain-containing protein n=1 Tax=unclassified Streptomyces TaxID=2593676 RepID=UPI00371CEFE6
MITRHRVGTLAVTAVLAATGGLVTATPASAAVTCASPVWKVQYFANTSLSGTPKLTGCDAAISENYGYGDPPGVVLPKDNFSVRWSVTRDFGSGGPFTLTAATQDGIRVYVDGVRRVDVWKNVSTTQKRAVNLTIPAGRHTLRVDFVAWTGAANVAFTYAPRTSATVDTVRPLAPTGTSVAYDAAANRATLRWAANKEMDLSGYRAYRRADGSSTWSRIGSSGLSAVDYPPATGKRYFYEVRAVDKAGNESAGSVDQPVTTVDRTAPVAPAGLKATDGPAGVALSWTPVPDAATYTVHRQRHHEADEYEPVTKVATVTSAAWTDPTGDERTGYTYWIRAADAAGNVSLPGSTQVVRGDHPPAPPTGLTTALNARSEVELTWTRSTSQDVTSYLVYRSETSPVPTGGEPFRQIWGNSYTDVSAGYGRTYHYAVVAVDGARKRSVASAEVSVTTPGDRVAPLPVTGLTATAREDGVLLEWDANTEPDLKRYDVYKGVWHPDEDDEEGGVWLYHHIAYLGEEDTSWLHAVTPEGRTVRYAVVGVDDWGNHRVRTGEDVAMVEVTELGGPPAG